MKNKCFVFLFLLGTTFAFSQTNIKGNLISTLALIPNIGIETKIGEKLTFQLDATASFWKSVQGGPQQFFMLFPEVRYHTNKINEGFFIGVHIGGAAYKIQKFNYFNSDYYQQGFSVFYGFTIGYQFKVTEKFNLELFLGGGSQQGYYKGYLLSTGERYEDARKFNKSGEIIPYRGGLMLVYKLK